MDKIITHVQQAQERLIELYKTQPNFNSLSSSIISQIQELEDTTFNVFENRWLFTAEGEQLDKLGESLGEVRKGRSDLEYRVAILTAISVNVGSGTPDLLINVIKQLYSTSSIDYKELYPASLSITFQSDVKIPEITKFIDSIKPAGVGKSTLMQYAGTPFVFGTIRGQETLLAVSPDDAAAGEIYVLGVETEDGLFPLEVTSEAFVECEGGQGFATIRVNRPFLEIEDEDGLAIYETGEGLLTVQEDTADQDYIFSTYGGNLATIL